VGAFQIVTALEIVHIPPSGGFSLYRLGGAVLCGVLGAAIGKWVGRPRTGK
jgi:outer membrane lipoprotein SlyB